MKKQKILKKAILIIVTLILFLMLGHSTVKAIFDPEPYTLTASEENVVSEQFSGVTDKITEIGRYAALITLSLIGIKFMMGSVEEKADYKQRMIPYVIGSIFVFSIASVISIIRNVGVDIISSGDVGAMGDRIYGIVSAVASTIAVIILVLLGIKYMSGGVEDKSEIKGSMMPYVIGAIVVFATGSIASMVQQMGAGMVSHGSVEGIAEEVSSIVQTAGVSAASIFLVALGIKYLMGSAEEKANYKQSMVPYLIGATGIYATSAVIGIVKSIAGDVGGAGSVEGMGNQIFSIIIGVGEVVASIALVILGIKYMMGSTEERAQYKKSMIPYLVGATIIFGISEISSLVERITSQVASGGSLRGMASQVFEMISIAGASIAGVILLMLGIKYLMGSVEEKADFKKSMSPYVIGAAVVFETSALIGVIRDITTRIAGGGNIEGIGDEIFSIISVIGVAIAGIILTALGIKYMMGSTEERAQYKKSLMPYIVGAIIIFATSSVLNLIQKYAAQTIGTGSVEGIGNEIGKIIGTIGSLLSVIILIALGIKYMFSGTQEKAEYKKSMFPYIIGAVVIFATAALKNAIEGVSQDVMKTGEIESIGQQIISVISVIGSLASVALLVTIGIRILISGTADKAEYKKSLMPYIIGATIIFAASQLAGTIYRFAIGL